MDKQPSLLDLWNAWLSPDRHLDSKLELTPHIIEPGDNPNLVLLTGENAGGKSLAIDIMRTMAGKLLGRDASFIDIGMRRRIAAGIERSFIFGHEGTESTGNVSIRTTIKALDNAGGWEKPCYVTLDEPDMGVGEGYHRPLGEFIADFARTMPPTCLGLLVVTHSRALASEILGAGACSIRVGRDLRPVGEWMRDGDLPKTREDLFAISENSGGMKRRFNALRAAMKADQLTEVAPRSPSI